jgi:hypothetical protein
MTPSNSPFGRAGQFFGGAFNELERATEMQERIQGVGIGDSRYASTYDTEYMQGAVPPQTGPYGEQQGPAADVEDLKNELLQTAREKNRPSNGSMAVRAGGGANTAIRG